MQENVQLKGKQDQMVWHKLANLYIPQNVMTGRGGDKGNSWKPWGTGGLEVQN